jgi:hypothetical protein
VDAAGAADEVVAGAEIEVVGVGKDDLGSAMVVAEGFEGVLRDGLDGGGGANGHEDGCFDGAVREMERGSAEVAVGGAEVEAKRHRLLIVWRITVLSCCDTAGVEDTFEWMLREDKS